MIKNKPIGEKMVTAVLSNHHRIHIKEKDALRGFKVLFQSSDQFGILPNDTYLVNDEHILLLKNANVRFETAEQKGPA